MTSWPQWPRNGLSIFFQKIHFLNQGKALRKKSYGSAFWSNFENYQFLLAKKVLKTGNFKSWTRKPSYSSFFSVLCPDLKNVFFFGKIHWAPSEILEVKRPFSRSWRKNFGFHLFLMSFHLEFSPFWVSRLFDLSDLGDLRRGPVNVFKNYIFEISAFKGERWGMFRLSRKHFH